MSTKPFDAPSFDEGVENNGNGWKYATITLVVIALLAGIAWIGAVLLGDDAATASPKQDSAQAPSVYDCPEGFPRVKIDTERADESFAAIPGGTPTVESFYKGLKEWPQFLAYRAANPLLAEAMADRKKLWEDGANWQPLVREDGKCLSETGYKLVLKMETVYNMATPNENDFVPANWYNSGSDRNGPVLNTEPGIPADKQRALGFTFPNGTKDYSMHHCGNYGLPAPSGIPQVPFKERPGSPAPPPAPPRVVPPPVAPPPMIPPPPPPPPPPVNPPPPCVEGCEPEPELVCPPEFPHGTPPACKDDVSNGPGQVVDVPQRPNPLPALPEHEEPDAPDVEYPTEPYVPPNQDEVIVDPPEEGGPTPNPEPPVVTAPEPEAPTEEDPLDECIPAPGMPC